MSCKFSNGLVAFGVLLAQHVEWWRYVWQFNTCHYGSSPSRSWSVRIEIGLIGHPIHIDVQGPLYNHTTRLDHYVGPRPHVRIDGCYRLTHVRNPM